MGIVGRRRLNGGLLLAQRPHAPLQGLVTVESPLSALRFDIDDNTGTYQGHARITAMVRDAKGAAIWTGRKDVNIHGPHREVACPSRGQHVLHARRDRGRPGAFTLEAKVEDLVGAQRRHDTDTVARWAKRPRLGGHRCVGGAPVQGIRG